MKTTKQILLERMEMFDSSFKKNIIDDIYKQSLNDDYWKNLSKKFPNYNTDNSETKKATEYIYNEIVNNNRNGVDWSDESIERALKNKIYDGIS